MAPAGGWGHLYPLNTRLELPVDSKPAQSHPAEAPASTRTDAGTHRGHGRETVRLFGMEFMAAADEGVVVADLLDWKPVDHTPALLVTPNVDIVVRLQEPELAGTKAQFADADWILPDGWPIVRASKFADRALPARLAGSTVFALWWPSVARAGRPVALAVSRSEIAEGLQREHPDSSVMVAPMMEPTLEAAAPVAAELVDRALEVDADFVVAGVGFPKDSLLASEFIRQWPADRPAPLFMCLGASAEMYLGLRRRAPEWMQRAGLEWFYRFAQEPRRMFHRYFVRDPKFIPLAAREIRAARQDDER